MATKPREGGSELFYVDEYGNKRDAELHEEILRQGNDAPGKAISDQIKARLLKEAGVPDRPWAASEADIAALTAAAAKRSPGSK